MQPQEQESDTWNRFILPNLHPQLAEEHAAAAAAAAAPPPKPEKINSKWVVKNTVVFKGVLSLLCM